MKSFSIIALTPKGELALLHQNTKRAKLSFLEKKTFDVLFYVEHLQNPSGICFHIRSSSMALVNLVNPKALTEEIVKSMEEEGAKKDIDFNLVLEE